MTFETQPDRDLLAQDDRQFELAQRYVIRRYHQELTRKARVSAARLSLLSQEGVDEETLEDSAALVTGYEARVNYWVEIGKALGERATSTVDIANLAYREQQAQAADAKNS